MKEMTEKQKKEFEEIARKMCKFINDNFDPHYIVIIENDKADIMQGKYGISMNGKYILD